MKHILTILITILLFASTNGQAPASFKYQAVSRNSLGQLIVNTQVSMQIGIIKGSITGSSVYVETFNPTTNSFGLVNLNIGTGTVVSGNFGTIDWGNDAYFIKVWLNGNEMGTSQLLSVPYALYAKKAETVENITITGNESAFDGWDKNSADNFNGQYNNLTGVPTFATVATSGNYNDLNNKPITDGSETKIVAGTNVNITGIGTSGDPYIINSKPNHYIGELYGGGIIVYVWKEGNNEHGLIASLTDYVSLSAWSNITNIEIGLTASSQNDGQMNTNAIINQIGHSSSAAKLCDDFVSGGYDDWYLPSAMELKQCYDASLIIHAILGVSGGFNQSTQYWSSTETNSNLAITLECRYGNLISEPKALVISFRPIRRF